jgi:hypothetical protein
MYTPDNAQVFELEQRIGKLLKSQRAFIFSPETSACIAGGFGCGKTRAGCLKGLVLSKLFPKNQGMMLCYHGTDLRDRVLPVFFEVCPPSWIRSYNKQNQIVTLQNESQIMFRPLHDSTAKGGTKSRRIGPNLGWFFIDQMEECDIEHWNVMISRLRNTNVPKHFAFGAINPNGHDWNYRMFFANFKRWEELPLENGKRPLVQVCRPRKNVLGIAVDSEENRLSNGGFVGEDFFDNMLAQYDTQWADRYIHCSFDDFTGKIYKTYRAGFEDPESASVHNIDPFPIPPSWELVVGIDVGGDSPWAIVPTYIDECGNGIVVDGLSKPSMNTADIAAWIKRHLPWNKPNTTFVIDWENKLAMLELAEYGIHCKPAVKHLKVGLLRTGTFFTPRRGYPLPAWYREYQPRERTIRFEGQGSPRLYVFNTFEVFRKEHDEYVWNPNKPDEPLKTGTKRFDTCDAMRYVLMSRPAPTAKETDIEKKLRYAEMSKRDPLSVKAWCELDARIERRMNAQKGPQIMHEAYDEGEQVDVPHFVKERWEFE